MDLFEAAGGAAGLRRLAEAWHERVMADDVVAHAFSSGFDPHHTERLAAYWAEAIGGPPEFTSRFGDESAVVRIHSGNAEHHEMDGRAIACFDAALVDAGLDDDVVRSALHDYFAWTTRETMGRYHHSADEVPNGLTMAHWSWTGLVLPSGSERGD